MAINLGSAYTLAAGVVNRANLNSIFAAIVSKFAGNIDNSDISSSANIAPTKLSASNQECWINFAWEFDLHGAWPAVSATTPRTKAIPLPGQSADTSWVATDVTWACNDVGTANGSFDVRYGHYDAAGAWTNDGSVTTGVTITRAIDNAGNQGRSARLAVTIPNGATVSSIALMSAGAGTGVVTAAGSFLCVSVRLRRVLQSI